MYEMNEEFTYVFSYYICRIVYILLLYYNTRQCILTIGIRDVENVNLCGISGQRYLRTWDSLSRGPILILVVYAILIHFDNKKYSSGKKKETSFVIPFSSCCWKEYLQCFFFLILLLKDCLLLVSKKTKIILNKNAEKYYWNNSSI